MPEKPPPVDGVEYPEKPDADASMLEKMQYMEAVDHYWSVRGSKKLDSDDESE